MNISNEQLRAVELPIRRKRIRIQLLDFDYRVVDEIEGVCIGGTLSKDANSDLRRSGSVTMSIPIDKNATTFLDSVQGFTITVGGKIWIDRYVKIFIGIDDYTQSPQKTVWYKFGVCLIDQPVRLFSATDYTISFNTLDLMGRLTGLRQGQLNTLTTVFEQGTMSDIQYPCDVDMANDTYTVNEGEYLFAGNIPSLLGAAVPSTVHTEMLVATAVNSKEYSLALVNRVSALNPEAQTAELSNEWVLNAWAVDGNTLVSDFYYFFGDTRIGTTFYAQGWYQGDHIAHTLSSISIPNFAMPFNAQSVFGASANLYFEPYQCADACNSICSTATYVRNETQQRLESVITELAGIRRYNIYPLPEKYKYLPYDIKVGIGATVYEILSKFMEILSTWQMYFDDDGVLIIEPIPSGIYSPALPMSAGQLISSETSFDFQNVKNQITIYGRLNSAASFGDATYDSEDPTVLFVGFKTLDFSSWTIGATVLAFQTPNEYGAADLAEIQMSYFDGTKTQRSLTANLTTFEGTASAIPAKSLLPNTIYCIRLSDATIDASGTVQTDYPLTFELLGKQQVAATLVNDNKQSPYYVNADLDSPNYFCGTGVSYSVTLNDSDAPITQLADGTLIAFMVDQINTEGQTLTVYSAKGGQPIKTAEIVNNDSVHTPMTAEKMAPDFTIFLVRYSAALDKFIFLGRHPYALTKVLSGGEYDNIYADQLADERCQWELFKASSMNNSIKIGIIPNYVLDVNFKIPFKDSWAMQPDAPVSEDEPTNYYLIKVITYPLGLDSTPQDITAIQVYDDDNLVGNDYEIPSSAQTYAVNYNLINCTAYSGNPTSISSDASGVQFRINKSAHYELPQDIGDITVTNATLDSWVLSADGTYGTATISAPTGDITIELEGIAEVYSITVSAPHTTHTGASTITYGQTATLVFAFDTGYEAPDAVTVIGATGTWTKSTGALVLSSATGNVSVSLTAVAKTYAIRVNGTHASATDGSPTTIKYGGTATLSFDYDRGYFAPAVVTVENADGNWDQDTNELVITNPDDTGDVIVTIEAIEKTYDIKYALTNLTAASSNPTTITSAATGVELTISGSAYYALPTSITVSGVATGDWSYDQATGKVTLSYPTGAVTITAVGVEISETIDGIWSWNTTIPDGVWTEQAVNFTSNGGSYSGMEWDGYDLYYIVAADGTKQKVYSFNEDTQVGTWADGGDASYWRIVDFGTTEATVSKIFADYVNANAVPSGKLATPAGVQVTDSEASWNEVENATQYEIVIDNASWGTHIPAVYNYTFDEATGVLTLLDAPYEQNGDTVTITDDSTTIVTGYKATVTGDLTYSTLEVSTDNGVSYLPALHVGDQITATQLKFKFDAYGDAGAGMDVVNASGTKILHMGIPYPHDGTTPIYSENITLDSDVTIKAWSWLGE